MVLLHGNLRVGILEGKQLEPKRGRFLKRLERGLMSSLDGLDPYCSLQLGDGSKVLQTPVVDNQADPLWNTRAEFAVHHDMDVLQFRVKSAKRRAILAFVGRVQHLGMLKIPAARLLAERTLSGWFHLGPYEFEAGEAHSSDEELRTGDGSGGGDFGEIKIDLHYTPVEEIPPSIEVPYCYYPARSGSRVKLYNDAVLEEGLLLEENPVLSDYNPGSCWKDVAKHIMEAKTFIYICGWAVWADLVLVRDGSTYNGMTVGEMLKQKAEDGVTVCVMVWDEVASNDTFGLGGLMGTHDEETIKYFKRTRVNACKVTRSNDKEGPFSDINDSLMFTHHQKCIITTIDDENSSDGRPRVVAFVGGLDLTNGRYDGASHSLFRTIEDAHAPPDFWQACATVGDGVGPREPWHDIHAYVTGRAAWDILDNFECRWRRQAPKKYQYVLHEKSAEVIVAPDEEESMNDGSWSAQILRSINESSAVLDHSRRGLVRRQHALIDQSIHRAYVQLIREAKSFIYIENQYFLGSSHWWKSSQRGEFADHLIPIEIASKICAKIRADERFYVMVVVPLFPEGPPDSAAVQEILSFQRKTVSVIVRKIDETIKETGSPTTVEDWFGMYCLANRESSEGGRGASPTTEVEIKLSESRRFMIYVHSKHMIVDDTVAVVGSANINMRSMDGGRDTEIAAMAWQPEHVATGSTAYRDVGEEVTLPRGEVAAFRAQLWKEHLGEWNEVFADPSSLECVQELRDRGMQNWKHFASDEEPTDMPRGAHLCRYPYLYEERGSEFVVNPLQEFFPDFPTALVKGKSGALPNLLTG